MQRRVFSGIGALAAAALLVGACSTPAKSGTASGGDRKAPFTIGVSNAFVASEYRTQMIDAIKATFDEYKAKGVVDKLVLENADADVNGQIQQIRNLINHQVDVIIVDPNSASALTAVFKEATDQGIKVIAIDQAVDSTAVFNVGISQEALGEASAQWFAAKVGDGANIVTVEGAAGNPATEARWTGAKKIFDQHGIKVLARGDGKWDQATGQTVTTNLLATYPNAKGVWTYDGMAQGVLRAVQAAGRTKDLVLGGEARVGFMRMWTGLKSTGFESVGILNPPGTGATALRIAIKELQGRKLDPSKVTNGHNLVLPLATAITTTNFDTEWAKVSNRADTYVLDSALSDAEVDSYFS